MDSRRTPEADQASNAVLDNLMHVLLEQHSAFRAFLRKRLSDDALVEDLLQQSLMKAVERHHDLKTHDSAVSWFYRILRNAVTDYYRSHAADHRKVEGLLQELRASEEDKTPAFDEVRPAICACLTPLLKDMRPSYADLLRRIDLEGEVPASVAKDLELTTNNLTVRLHRARQALRARLEQVCGVCTRHGCLNCTCA
ncbi:MAG: sigma-70 family RNA polymerase sigma factor [Nitrospirota bacterium]|nr:sigma-70 family RNA polymerase sigma factor [Nitrospirota bacterium]MDP3595628.1 sigma-70 family RNA polymerase sigma factor [Nitrospirota bacterium]